MGRSTKPRRTSKRTRKSAQDGQDAAPSDETAATTASTDSTAPAPADAAPADSSGEAAGDPAGSTSTDSGDEQNAAPSPDFHGNGGEADPHGSHDPVDSIQATLDKAHELGILDEPLVNEGLESAEIRGDKLVLTFKDDSTIELPEEAGDPDGPDAGDTALLDAIAELAKAAGVSIEEAADALAKEHAEQPDGTDAVALANLMAEHIANGGKLVDGTFIADSPSSEPEHVEPELPTTDDGRVALVAPNGRTWYFLPERAKALIGQGYYKLAETEGE